VNLYAAFNGAPQYKPVDVSSTAAHTLAIAAPQMIADSDQRSIPVVGRLLSARGDQYVWKSTARRRISRFWPIRERQPPSTTMRITCTRTPVGLLAV